MAWFIYALITAILVSASVLAQKRALLREHAMEFSTILAFINLAISLPLFLIIDYSALSWTPIIILFFATMLGALAFLFTAKGVRHMEISDASPLFAFGPAFTAVFALIFLGEAITGWQVAGIALLIAGSFILETKRHQTLLDPIKVFIKSRYIHFILFALALYAITSVVDRYILGQGMMNPLAYIAFAHVFLAIHFFIMSTVFHDGLKGVKHGLKRVGWWIVLVAVFTVGYRLSQALAVTEAEVALVSAVKRTSALFTVIVGGELFHEANLPRKIVACVIMVVGALLIIL